MISIGTIGLIKGITTFDASKGARLATYAARCVENEILMYFRGQKKSAQDVSLSDYIETGTDGAALSLMDVVSEDGDLLEQVSSRESAEQLHRAIRSCLTEQEREVVVLRYGLNGKPPKRQRRDNHGTGSGRWRSLRESAGAMYPGLRSGRCRSCGGNWRNDICGGAASVLVSGVCVRRKIFRDLSGCTFGCNFFCLPGFG